MWSISAGGVAWDVGSWQILLQKSLALSVNGDSVALMRLAAEAGDDGAGSITMRDGCFIHFASLFERITTSARGFSP